MLKFFLSPLLIPATTTSLLYHPTHTQTFTLSVNIVMVYLSYKVLLLPIMLLIPLSLDVSPTALAIIPIQIKY